MKFNAFISLTRSLSLLLSLLCNYTRSRFEKIIMTTTTTIHKRKPIDNLFCLSSFSLKRRGCLLHKAKMNVRFVSVCEVIRCAKNNDVTMENKVFTEAATAWNASVLFAAFEICK